MITDAIRNGLKESIAEGYTEILRELDLRADVAWNGWVGVNQMSDQELVDDYLDDYQTQIEYENELDLGDTEDWERALVDTDEYRDYWRREPKTTLEEVK